ncbi:MAG: hypothetical protein ACO1OC_06010 [Tuberibacillus sp.]
MKKLMVCILTVLTITGLTACGGSKQNEGTKSAAQDFYDQIKKSGQMTIGTEGTYPPFTYHNGQMLREK